ncbi:MAG TPA: hypothetical protein DEP35_03365 [Deltaproteobacteria bacterium]|nr:hypothetical protein [Deltaproteobacteria bacterium]
MSLSAPDPFGVTADPETYMPRAATERALAELEQALLAGEIPVLFTGPAGIGKTLLLRVAERRLAGRVRCVYVAYGALSPAELCSWILGLLGESAPPNGDAEAALLAAAHGFAQAGTPLALLIDDASAVPPETAERMRSLAASSRGALQIVAADMEDASTEPWGTRFGARVERVTLETPMSAAETALYIRARLERGGVSPDHGGRLDTKVIDRIFRRSSGIPRAVQALASEFLRVGEAALPREALEALLAHEDAAELARAAAARRRAREILPPERTEQPRGASSADPAVRAIVWRPPGEGKPLFSAPRALATPTPSQPTSEPVVRELAPARSPTASGPAAKPTAKPQKHLPSVTSSPPSVAQPAPKRTPSRETPGRRVHWPGILVAVLGLGGAIALALPFLRGAPAVPERLAPVLETGSSPTRAPSEAAGDASIGVAPPEPQKAQPDTPPAPQPEAARPLPSGSAEPEASKTPAHLAAEVPVAPIPVHINATPWATIEVDGVDVGETPIAGVPLVPGNHVFKARMPDGRVVEKTVQIGAGTRYVTFE